MPHSHGDRVPIRTVCSLTGVNAVTLRAWERRYGFIRPLRTPKGHRLYTYAHIEIIRRVLGLVERGVPISQVGRLIDAEAESQPRRGAAAHGPWRDYLERMTAAIVRLDEQELDQIYEQALSVHSAEKVTRHLTLPLLVLLGDRWKTVTGAIAEEHFLAMYLRSKLGASLIHGMRYGTGPRLLAACAPGEFHEIGLLLFALEAQNAGMRTVLLGADTPIAELAMAQRRCAADALVISSYMDPAPGLLERELPGLTAQAGVPVFVGGATATRHEREINAAGAIALGCGLADAVRLISTKLTRKKSES
jgi:MerR family transcriptional regulator, light-induced transcriptional regulator